MFWEVDVLIGQHTCDNLIALLIYLQLIVFIFYGGVDIDLVS